MDHSPRHQQLIEILEERHFASISELAQEIYVSEATVRRDLQKLEQKGVVKSVYGGVMLSQYRNEAVPISLRDRENSSKKEMIALAAAALIRDNDTVIFDSSSTVRRICKHIKNRKNLTVITNNLRVCQEFKDSSISVYCTGGSLVSRRECFLGHYAEEFIRSINADALFFSSQGLSDNGDITDSSEEEISLRKIMLARSKQKIFLCDSSKFGKSFPFRLCGVDDATEVISDTPFPSPE